ncbi:hypothetical protein [Candidatus Clostridium radicumherbarum]|uniref:Uncharacterized protein n=1 Tax=Candidatus Clostridium radicumherbarum TaxID=3381662 RepID=A0ABW8TRK6_9CLOT
MLKKIDLGSLSEIFRTNVSSSNCTYEIIHAPFMEDIYKVDCYEILKTNNLIQILTGIAYHNDFQQLPITLEFKVGISLIELINLPTVRLLPSTFENIRILSKDKIFYGVWIKKLSEKAKLAYKELLNEDKIDNSLKSIFRIDTKRNIISKQQMITAFELITEENTEYDCKIINDKLISYLLYECNKNNGFYGVPLSGWELDSIEACKAFLKLKKTFDRVFLVGSGQVWQSTHLVVSQPQNKLFIT